MTCTTSRSMISVARAIALASAALAGTSSAQSAGDKVSPGNDLGEIVVTATKRSEPLQSVPIAISAVTGESLLKMGATDFAGYARSIPSLSFTDTGTGQSVVAIRGINPSVGAGAVHFYIDETPIPVSQGNYGGGQLNPKLVDVDRVEVLRGPQGTLYGAGSVGGTIRLIPKAPDPNHFSGAAQINGTTIKGGGEGYEAQGLLNIPLIAGKAALRLNVWDVGGGGYITRTWAQPTPGEQKNVGRDDTWGFRATGKYHVSDAVTIDAMVYHEAQKLNGYQNITAGPSNPSFALVQSFPWDVAEPNRNGFTLYSVTGTADLNRFRLTSATSYFRSDRRTTEEQTAFAVAAFGPPAFYERLDEENDRNQFSEEIRLATAAPINHVDFVVGLFYQQSHGDLAFNLAPPEWNSIYAPNGPSDPLYTPGNQLFVGTAKNKDSEISEFTEITWHATDRLDVTGGVRHFHTSTSEHDLLTGLFNGGPTDTAVVAPASTGQTYKANVSYKLTKDNLLYATYSEGFRPGFGYAPVPSSCGFPGPYAVGPDTLKNYEIGSKNAWLDHKVIVNVSAFDMTWKNIQQSKFLQCGFTIVSNSTGSVRSKGGEAEIVTRPLEFWELGLSGSLTDAKFQQNESFLTAREGDQLAGVPRYQVAAYLSRAVHWAEHVSGELRVDVQHTDQSHARYARLSDGQFDPLYQLGSTTLLGARAQANFGAWSVALYGNNLTNDVSRQFLVVSSGADTPGRPRLSVNQPRTVGIEIRNQF